MTKQQHEEHSTVPNRSLSGEQRPCCTSFTTVGDNTSKQEIMNLFLRLLSSMVSLYWGSVTKARPTWESCVCGVCKPQTHTTHTWSPIAGRLGAAEKSKQQALSNRINDYNPNRPTITHVWVNNRFDVTAKYNLHLPPQCQDTFENTIKWNILGFHVLFPAPKAT